MHYRFSCWPWKGTGQWRDLVAEAGGRESVDDGVLLSFPPHAEIASRIAELAAAEQGWCAFFDFTLHLTSSAFRLTVRAPEGADGMLADLFGDAS
ncbi:hypothetical protein [Streptomyces lavendofoliae]|uniref:hypothetical protein n=1 Tax=Streptomyces lavendofoliae TaxID=67314 RepID=UPI003D941128